MPAEATKKCICAAAISYMGCNVLESVTPHAMAVSHRDNFYASTQRIYMLG